MGAPSHRVSALVALFFRQRFAELCAVSGARGRCQDVPAAGAESGEARGGAAHGQECVAVSCLRSSLVLGSPSVRVSLRARSAPAKTFTPGEGISLFQKNDLTAEQRQAIMVRDLPCSSFLLVIVPDGALLVCRSRSKSRTASRRSRNWKSSSLAAAVRRLLRLSVLTAFCSLAAGAGGPVAMDL
jgi:hypothetical protein